MSELNLGLRISILEERLGAIETSLRRRGLLDSLPPASPPPFPAHAASEAQVSASTDSSPPAPVLPVAAPPLPPVFTGSPRPFPAPPPLLKSLGQKAELLHYPRTTKPAPILQGDFEKTIGLKWAGWIGALVFVIGAVLGVKYAYDQGWFHNLIPQWMWLSLIAAAGVTLIAAGEWVYRKINHLSAAGLFAAGVATLFVASYSGHSYYEVYSQSIAFICMAISAIIGAAVAIRGNMVSIGVISLLGANIAPLLLGDRNAPISSLLTYLFATQIVALILAARGNSGKWWTLRGLSLATIAFWMLSVLNEHRTATVTLVFAIVYAAVYQIELIFTNSRKDRQDPTRGGEAAGLAFSMFVTAGLTGALVWIHKGESDITQTAWVLGVSAVCGALGLLLPSMKRPALTDLATGYALQAIALLFVAVPLYTTGMNVEFGWLLLALGLALVGVLGNKDLSRATSLLAWGLALLHLIIRNGNESTHEVLTNTGGFQLHTNGAIAFGLAIAGQIIAMLANVRQKDGAIVHSASAVSIIATLTWCVAALIELPMSSATFVILAYAWGLIAAGKLLPERIGFTLGGVLLIGSAAKWLIFDAIVPAITGQLSNQLVMFNSMTLTAAVLIVSGIVFVVMTPKLLLQPRGERDVRIALKLAIAVIGLVDLSIEISRWIDTSGAAMGLNDPALARQVALSIFWACYAVALVGVGFSSREAALRYMGLILLAATLLKVVTVDLSGVSQGYRTLSFIGLGLLMLGTSVLYGKVSPKLLSQVEKTT